MKMRINPKLALLILFPILFVVYTGLTLVSPGSITSASTALSSLASLGEGVATEATVGADSGSADLPPSPAVREGQLAKEGGQKRVSGASSASAVGTAAAALPTPSTPPTTPLSKEALLAFIRSKGITSNINPCVWERYEADYIRQKQLLAEEIARHVSGSSRPNSAAAKMNTKSNAESDAEVVETSDSDRSRSKSSSTRAAAPYVFLPPRPITREEMLAPLPSDVSSDGTTRRLNASALPPSIPVYMVHYTPMRSRRVELTRMLAEHHAVYPEWVLGFDKEAMTAEDSACYFTFNGEDFTVPPRAYSPAAAEGGVVGHVERSPEEGELLLLDRHDVVSNTSSSLVVIPVLAPQSRLVPDVANHKANRHNKALNPLRGGVARPTLKGGQQSVVTKHHSALYRVLRNNDAMAVILEDDAFLRNGFKQRLGEIISEIVSSSSSSASSSSGGGALPPSMLSSAASDPYFDVLWIGGCMKMRGWRRKFDTTYVSRHLYGKREARCAHAYLVSQAGAAKLLNGVPFTLPIDFQYSAAMREGAARSYWVEPWLSIQGDMGACVTNSDLGAGCVSVERGYDPAFDPKKMKEVDAGWERIPPFKSKR